MVGVHSFAGTLAAHSITGQRRRTSPKVSKVLTFAVSSPIVRQVISSNVDGASPPLLPLHQVGPQRKRPIAPSWPTCLAFSPLGEILYFLLSSSPLVVANKLSRRGDLVRAVFGTPGQVYKKHKSLMDAHIYYADMQRKGLVQAIPYHGRHPLPPPIPTPPGLPPPPQTSKTTYAVTQGRHVGVYHEW